MILYNGYPLTVDEKLNLYARLALSGFASGFYIYLIAFGSPEGLLLPLPALLAYWSIHKFTKGPRWKWILGAIAFQWLSSIGALFLIRLFIQGSSVQLFELSFSLRYFLTETGMFIFYPSNHQLDIFYSLLFSGIYLTTIGCTATHLLSKLMQITFPMPRKIGFGLLLSCSLFILLTFYLLNCLPRQEPLQEIWLAFTGVLSFAVCFILLGISFIKLQK